MKTYTTVAHHAEEEMEKYFGHGSRVYKPWQLEKHIIEPVHIRGTVDDVLLLSQANVYVRPNFNADENVVEIPNLFCKLNGDIDGFYLDMQLLKSENPDIIDIYDGFNKMARQPKKTPFRKRPIWFDEHTGINVDLAIKHGIASIEVLRPEYQRNYLKAINRVLRTIKSVGYIAEKPTSREVLEVLLFNSNKIIKMYHHFDYQYINPKFIVRDNKKRTISPFAVIRLMMMNALGFDVFILSNKGYSSIENYLSKDICDSYYLTSKERIYSKVLSRRANIQKWIGIGFIGLIGLAVASSIIKMIIA